MTSPSTPQTGQDGSTSTELVLLMPVVLTLVLLVVQLGLWLHARHVAVAAAQEGLVAAQVERGTEDLGRDRALEFADTTGGLLEVTAVATRDVRTARVEVRGEVPAVLPGWSLHVSAVAEGPTESFLAETQR